MKRVQAHFPTARPLPSGFSIQFIFQQPPQKANLLLLEAAQMGEHIRNLQGQYLLLQSHVQRRGSTGQLKHQT